MRPNRETKPLCSYIHLAPGRKDWESWIWQTSSSLGFSSSPTQSRVSKGMRLPRQSSATPSRCQVPLLDEYYWQNLLILLKFSSHRHPLHLDFSVPFLSLSPVLSPAPCCPRTRESSFTWNRFPASSLELSVNQTGKRSEKGSTLPAT